MKLACKEFITAFKADAKTKLLLDVRNPDETAGGTVKNAVVIPLPQLEQRFRELSLDSHIYIYCRSGRRAETAYDFLKSKGYKHLFCGVEGGYDDLAGSFSQ